MGRTRVCHCRTCLSNQPDGVRVSLRTYWRHKQNDQGDSEALHDAADHVCKCARYPDGHNVTRATYFRHKKLATRQTALDDEADHSNREFSPTGADASDDIVDCSDQASAEDAIEGGVLIEDSGTREEDNAAVLEGIERNRRSKRKIATHILS